MLMLTRKQLNDVLNFEGNSNDLISESHIRQLYKKYGDVYYADSGMSYLELCIENPFWKDKRGQTGYPQKGYKVK